MDKLDKLGNILCAKNLVSVNILTLSMSGWLVVCMESRASLPPLSGISKEKQPIVVQYLDKELCYVKIPLFFLFKCQPCSAVFVLLF